MVSSLKSLRFLLLLVCCCITSNTSNSLEIRPKTNVFDKSKDTTMPPPWTRELYLDTEYLVGSDVLIMCTLLHRDDAVLAQGGVDECDEIFDVQDESGVIFYLSFEFLFNPIVLRYKF